MSPHQAMAFLRTVADRCCRPVEGVTRGEADMVKGRFHQCADVISALCDRLVDQARTFEVIEGHLQDTPWPLLKPDDNDPGAAL
jgi:hypothetical protein